MYVRSERWSVGQKADCIRKYIHTRSAGELALHVVIIYCLVGSLSKFVKCFSLIWDGCGPLFLEFLLYDALHSFAYLCMFSRFASAFECFLMDFGTPDHVEKIHRPILRSSVLEWNLRMFNVQCPSLQASNLSKPPSFSKPPRLEASPSLQAPRPRATDL